MPNILSPFLSESEHTFDYIIVGGGTAGCVLANRLSGYLPDRKILLIEGGPSDQNIPKVLNLKDWLSVLEGELDYAYTTTPQPFGNSFITHSRARVLGGCSSHNTLISFRPLKQDAERWVQQGAKGWGFDTFMRLADKLKNNIQPVAQKDRNQLVKDWVDSCSTSLNIPISEDFNKTIKNDGKLTNTTGFLSISYHPETGKRSSASVAYIHPILDGIEKRNNLTILTESLVQKILFDPSKSIATGVVVKLITGEIRTFFANREIVLCAGAIDTPRLLLLSGVGPRQELDSVQIPVVAHVPGVGENLLDHPETIIMWELNKDVPPETTMDSDGAIFLRYEEPNRRGNDEDAADIMMHCYQIPFTLNLTRLGYDTPADRRAFCMTPNITRPRSRGRVFITSNDPNVKPSLDFQYFTDDEGYDAKILTEGIKAARKVAEQEPFKSWLKREVAPGPHIQKDEDINEYARRAAHTVYHPAGTTRMGAASDPMAVVDPELKVKHFKNLRIADAGVFPDMTTVNPMVTVLCIGERAAELIAEADSRSKL